MINARDWHTALSSDSTALQRRMYTYPDFPKLMWCFREVEPDAPLQLQERPNEALGLDCALVTELTVHIYGMERSGGQTFEWGKNNCFPYVCFDVLLVCAGTSPSLVTDSRDESVGKNTDFLSTLSVKQ